MSRATDYTADLSGTIRDFELYIGDLQLAVKRARRQIGGLQNLERSLDHQARQLAHVGWDRKDETTQVTNSDVVTQDLLCLRADATTQVSESLMTEDISDTESEDEAERADATTQVSESLMTEDISDTESEDGDLVASSTAATSTTDSLDVDRGEVDIDREVQECLRASMAPIQDRPPTPWPSTNVSDVDEDEDYRRMTLKMELDGAFEGLDD